MWYVLEAYRGRGLGKWLIGVVMAHPDLQGLRRFALATRDAHGLYAPFGFAPLQRADRHMEIRPAGCVSSRGRGRSRMTLDVWQFVVVGMAALAAGMVNALAGGGTLISFPVMTAVGLPAVAANVTNTVALCPGMMGGIMAQRRDLTGQGRRLWMTLPLGAVGGVLGGVLLITTGERAFRTIIPYLILLATGLLAMQDRLRVWLIRHPHHERPATFSHLGLPVGIGAIYAGTSAPDWA